MKYLLPLLLLSCLASAGEEPGQIYLYIVMNGERSQIRVLHDKHDTLESCERAVSETKGNHARAVVICGKDLKKEKQTGLRNGRAN